MNGLTCAQIDALVLMARGFSDAEAAQALGTQTQSINERIKVVMQKLNARNRPHAVSKGFKAGIITPAMIAELEGARA